MFRFFKCKINNSWGLHITDHHLRCVEVAGDLNNWHIVRLGKVDLPQGLIKNGQIQDLKLFQEAIRALLSKTFPTPEKSPYVIVNLAEEHVFSRVIQTPPLSQKETNEALKWEAESNIPLPIEKVYLAWESLPEKKSQFTPPEQVKMNYVLLSAVSKDIIDSLMKALQTVGLKPVVIEAEASALARGLYQTQSFPSNNIPILIVNLREYYTSFIAFDSQVAVLSTSSENCSEKFDTAIKENFKISDAECEKYRHQIGWNSNDEFGKKLIEATSIQFSALKKDITSALSFFENKSGKRIEGVLITGEKMSKWSYFDRFLASEIGLPVRWQSSWNPKIWPANCPYVTTEKEEYNVCIGLALRKLEEEF
jgi:type IV pilus assembly protein PilM